MKEPYGEGVASRTDPESCVVSREAGRELLTGAHAGRVSSREIPGNQDADLVYSWEGNTGGRYREHNAPGRRVQRRANGCFTHPPWHARQQQAHEIRANDQQNRAHCRQQENQPASLIDTKRTP